MSTILAGNLKDGKSKRKQKKRKMREAKQSKEDGGRAHCESGFDALSECGDEASSRQSKGNYRAS